MNSTAHPARPLIPWNEFPTRNPFPDPEKFSREHLATNPGARNHGHTENKIVLNPDFARTRQSSGHFLQPVLNTSAVRAHFKNAHGIRSMSREYLTLDELVLRLGRDRRIVEKQVQRGIIPGRRIAGEWRFNETELTHWLEQDLRELDEQQLAQLESSQNSEELETHAGLETVLPPETCQVPLDAGTKPSVLQELVEVAGRTWQVWDPTAILRATREREEIMSTAFETGVAIPHPRNPLPEALGQSVVAFGRTLSGIHFGGPRRSTTDMFFLVLARDSRTHLQILARLGRLLHQPDFVEQLRNTHDSTAARSLILKADAELATFRTP